MIARRWLRERQALLLGLVLALLVSAAAHVSIGFFLAHERRQADSAAFAEAGRDAQAARLTLLRTLDAVDALAQMLRERHLLAAEGNPQGVAALEALARRMVSRRAFGILQVAVIGADGRVAWSSVDDWRPVDLSDRAHFRAHLPGPDGRPPPDRPFISEPLVGRLSAQPTLQVSRGLRNADGSFAGVAVVSLDPADLARLLAELLPDSRGVISVLRDDGVFLTRSRDPSESVGRSLTPDSPAMQVLRTGQDADIRTLGAIRGRDIFAALRRLPGTPIFVTANLDARAVGAPLERVTALLRAGEIALALILIGAATLVRQRYQRQRNLAALAAAEATRLEMARVLAGLPGAAYRAEIDASGQFRFLYGSPAIVALTGMRHSALRTLGAWLNQVEAVEPPGALEGLHSRAAAAGRQSADMLFRRPDGRRRWLRATVQPVRRGTDGQVEFVGYVADITAQREAMSNMVNNAKLATLGEMATGLAHELNQPISIMALAAENAGRSLRRRGEAAIPDALQRMDRIGQLAQRAKGIIDHLRAFGRTDPGALEPVALRQAMEGATMLTGAALREAEIALSVELPETLPPVRGRLLLLEQVLINLLLNARDAMRDTPVADRRIGVVGRVVGAQVVLTVTDSGPGIPAAVMPRLFEPFFTTKPTGQGTGLGLSLCHGIMRSLGGTISAANGADGTEFVLVLQPAMPSVAAAATVLATEA